MTTLPRGIGLANTSVDAISVNKLECETACFPTPSLSKLRSRDFLDTVCFAYDRSSMLASLSITHTMLTTVSMLDF